MSTITQQQRQAILADRNEWDFSVLTKCSLNEQRAAFDWELARERERDGRSSPLRALGYSTNLDRPWLCLTSKQRKEHIAACVEHWTKPAVRALTPEEATRFYKRFNGVPDIADRTVLEALRFSYTDHKGTPTLENPVRNGESVHVIAIDWNSEKADQVYGALERFAKSWRKTARGTKRNRNETPMAWLWNLSCYRLTTLAGLSFDQANATLTAIPEFEGLRPHSSNEAIRKCSDAIKARLRPVGYGTEKPTHVGLLVHSKPSGRHVVFGDLKGRSLRAKVITSK